jgi:hypothetical protein
MCTWNIVQALYSRDLEIVVIVFGSPRPNMDIRRGLGRRLGTSLVAVLGHQVGATLDGWTWPLSCSNSMAKLAIKMCNLYG